VSDDVAVAGHDVLRVDLEGSPASVGEARRFVRRTLQSWHLEAAVDATMLLTSELATNAVLHARSGFAVLVAQHGDQVRVEVLDSSPVPPRRRHNSPTAATGRGVGLVETLSTAWGVTPKDQLEGFAKGVWFTVPIEGG
jgi:anti-sigma regulatory factor (Ser/Thr protein kinase)